MTALNEELLGAWLQLSTTIINNKVVSDMPYNESLICNILYRNQLQNPQQKLTATDLCNETKMLKSQMNRTLNQMEEKKLIIRERSDRDKRQVFVTLDMDNAASYQQQHEKILQLADAIIEKTGQEKALEIISLFKSISSIAEGIIK
ncbi:MAG: MarR family transcriptional regulator [Eubacteriales bacterium]|nr:MarR family transcriptional regulator [Eubacteriales bacterium]